MFVFFQNLYVKVLIPYVMVLGGAVFGMPLGHEGGALRNGINALKKETPESSLTPSTM